MTLTQSPLGVCLPVTIGPQPHGPSSSASPTLTPSTSNTANTPARPRRRFAVGVMLALLSLVAAWTSATSAVTLEQRIQASANDGEESPTGTVNLTSSSLQLVFDTSLQTVGMRWTGISIPAGATITAAYVQFYASQSQSEVTNLTIAAQAADNPGAFTTATGNISGRPRTTAATPWSPPAWLAGEIGPNERTPDLTTALQEVVSRPGWASGSAVAIIVTGTGHRTAWSWDGRHGRAPLLHVEYTPPDYPPVARLAVSQLAIPALTVSADAAGSSDTDLTPIATYHFNFGDGTPVVDVAAPATTAQHTYAAAGTYTIALTATDTGNNTSAPVSVTLNVQPELPPTASLTVTQPPTPALTVNADASGSTDPDLTPIASYRFDFGDGTIVTTTAPTATAQHTYAAAGSHTVTLTVTDTGNNTSAPVTASITLPPPPPPVDLPPVGSLSVVQLASPSLSVSADASGSTDTDATPIATYHFDFGDGAPIVDTTPPTATAQHTYAAAGTYTITLTVTDTGNLTSAPVTVSKNVTGSPIAVYVGYYDTHHAVNPQPKPSPWRGAANTIFIGTQDNQPGDPPGGGWDTGCIRVDNLTGATLTGVVVTANIGTKIYALWGTNNIPAGQTLVLAQTVFENFDGSDRNPAGCYGCDPAQCLTLKTSIVPVVHVAIGGGATTDYPDPGQYLNTHGADAAGCPYVGGPLPQTRYDESEAWVQVYAAGSAPGRSGAAPPATAAVSDWGRVLALAPPSPNPARGDLTVRFAIPESGPVHIALFDLQGRLVRPFVDNILEAATYSFQTRLEGVLPGIYFVRMWTPQGARSQKLVLMH